MVMRCAKTGLPMLPFEDACALGLPELGRVTVLYFDDSRAVDLPLRRDGRAGGIDLEEDLQCNACRVVISKYAHTEDRFDEMAFNDSASLPGIETLRDEIRRIDELVGPGLRPADAEPPGRRVTQGMQP